MLDIPLKYGMICPECEGTGEVIPDGKPVRFSSIRRCESCQRGYLLTKEAEELLEFLSIVKYRGLI